MPGQYIQGPDGKFEGSEPSGEGGSGEWKPVMSAEEASAWNAGSAFTEPFYHGTDSTAAASIEQQGFIPGPSVGQTGAGVYVTSSQNWGEIYASGGITAGSSAEPTVLQTAINVQNPADEATTHALIREYEPPQSAWMPGTPEYNAGLQQFVSSKGYDAMTSMTGRDRTVVVLDPQNVTVVK